MLPVKSAYGQWPASGEIDIMESKGNTDLTLDGRQVGNQLDPVGTGWGQLEPGGTVWNQVEPSGDSGQAETRAAS